MRLSGSSPERVSGGLAGAPPPIPLSAAGAKPVAATSVPRLERCSEPSPRDLSSREVPAALLDPGRKRLAPPLGWVFVARPVIE